MNKTKGYELYVNLTAKYFNLSLDDLKSKKRNDNLVSARRFLTAYLFEYHKLSDTNIGLLINKDRTTLIHNYQTHKNYIDTERKYKQDYQNYVKAIHLSESLFANNNDLAKVINDFEVKAPAKFNEYYKELKEILVFKNNPDFDVFSEIRKLLLNTKVDEYTLNDNRLYSFIEIVKIVLEDERLEYLNSFLTQSIILDLTFVILQAKHIASINKIRTEIIQTSKELIIEKYVDCLNYYILYELYLRAKL
jgi:hypothetical protein